MRKFWVGILLLLAAGAGYLAYDWYQVVQHQQNPTQVILYSWTDARGLPHFTDTPPPAGARDVVAGPGYALERKPLIITLKEAGLALYRRLRAIFADEPESEKKFKKIY